MFETETQWEWCRCLTVFEGALLTENKLKRLLTVGAWLYLIISNIRAKEESD